MITDHKGAVLWITHLFQGILQDPFAIDEGTLPGIDPTSDPEIVVEERQADVHHAFTRGIVMGNVIDGAVALQPDVTLQEVHPNLLDLFHAHAIGIRPDDGQQDLGQHQKHQTKNQPQCKRDFEQTIDTDPAGFEGDNLVVLVHQTEHQHNCQQGAGGNQLLDRYARHKIKGGLGGRQSGFDKIIHFFKKIGDNIDYGNCCQRHTEIAKNLPRDISIQYAHSSGSKTSYDSLELDHLL